MCRVEPYRWRTKVRRHLPWFLINLGLADKGANCEAVGGQHEWYNRDGKTSGCYHCHVEKAGRLWEAHAQQGAQADESVFSGPAA
jgi:hypothetical protein